ncbi:MAG: TetR family transcriptional regulator, partial [Frankiales bacterium]|nr:TetR family transcriptional regulator [Frankiales bacterium]
PVELGLRLWAAAHGVAALLIAKPDFPWPADLDAFVDSTICMAGLGLAMQSRLTGLDDLPLPALLARLSPP